MLTLWMALAMAAPVQGQVRVGKVPVVDARVVVFDAQGIATETVVYTDARGRFEVDAPADSLLHITRIVRSETGSRMQLIAADVAVDEARRITLDRVDVGGGAVRLVGGRLGQAQEALKSVRKHYDPVQDACAAILDTDDRAAAREQATVHAEALAVGFGTGFEGCALRRFGSTDELELAERYTHNLDAAAGPGGQPLWAGLASVSFAEWSLVHEDYARARRAAGAAVTRLAGLTGSQAGSPVGESARPLLATAYEVEGEAALALQDAQGAVSKFHQSLRVHKQTGDVAGMGRSELGIARAELMRGRLEPASEHLSEALGLPLSATHRALLDELQVVLRQALDEQQAAASQATPPQESPQSAPSEPTP